MIDFIKNLSPEAWTALATWILVAGTLWAVWWQAREQRKIHAFDLIMKLSSEYESPSMKKHRKEAATFLLAKGSSDMPSEACQQVEGFFDTIGMLIQMRMLDKYVAWHEFAFAGLRYHSVLADRIDRIRVRLSDSTLHADFDRLHNVLLNVECKARGNMLPEKVRPTGQECERFLNTEKDLAV